MTTLADKAILSGADNRPPMLEKDMYDSWKSIMELYMMNRQHGRMILESVENGPLIWPTIEENGVTRPRKYSELTPADAIQADCDVKATNIILQGLPPEVYALVSNHRIAKELWERIQLLMQGTSLTKQERECKLYDEFDKFAYKKGETLRDFYLRFSLLLNDMNIYNVKLEQFQVNTKFLNTLPPEWSKFVTDVKLVRDLHTTNIDQLHAYLGQHEFHANEVRLMHERNSDPLALVATHQMTQSPYQTHQNSYQNSQFQPQVSLYQSPQHGLIVPVFQKDDDPIDAINNMMSFLTAVVTSRYPTTNNQLRNSSNPRQQATINDERVTLQPIQGRQTSFAAGSCFSKFLNSSAQQDALILSVIKQLKTQVINCTKINLDNKSVNDTLTAELERYKEQVKVLKEGQNVDLKTQQLEPKLYDGNVIKNTSAIVIPDFEETLMLAEENRSKMLLKQQDPMVLEKKVNTTPVDYAIPSPSCRPTKVEVPKELPKVSMSQEKDTVIKKLKERIKSLSGNMNKDKVKKDIEEIETINIELDHREKDLVITALKDELRKLKGKDLADNVVTKNTIAPEMLKIDVEPIAPKLLNNRTAHSDYLRHTLRTLLHVNREVRFDTRKITKSSK
ncbi:hypothetical protein Tco_1075030 [Tanacetum coccineum]